MRLSKNARAEMFIAGLLPQKLVDFVRAGGTLETASSRLGKVRVKSLSELRIGTIYVAPIAKVDPNLGRDGVYRVPAISLLAECQRYDPDHILSYLPLERMFCVFDSDHARITVFPDATWSDIACEPNTYIDTLWQSTPVVKHLRTQIPWWLTHAFNEDESD
jgi:hypothetical protein